MSAPTLAPAPAFPSTENGNDGRPIAHIFDPDETPRVSLCGVEIDDDEHICDDTSCDCLVCPACDAIEHLELQGQS